MFYLRLSVNMSKKWSIELVIYSVSIVIAVVVIILCAIIFTFIKPKNKSQEKLTPRSDSEHFDDSKVTSKQNRHEK